MNNGLTRVSPFIIFVNMPIRQKKPIKINGPVINAQGYNIANYLNNHINDYVDELFIAYNGSVKIDGHKCRIISDCMPVLKLHGSEEICIAVTNQWLVIEAGDIAPSILTVDGIQVIELPNGQYARKHGTYNNEYNLMSPSAMARHPKKRHYYTSAELIYQGRTTPCNMLDLVTTKSCIESCINHGDMLYTIDHNL